MKNKIQHSILGYTLILAFSAYSEQNSFGDYIKYNVSSRPPSTMKSDTLNEKSVTELADALIKPNLVESFVEELNQGLQTGNSSH